VGKLQETSYPDPRPEQDQRRLTGMVAQRYATGIRSLRVAARLHATLLQNAGALAIGAGASSVFGFAYWWVAARYLSLETVGLAAAAVSSMSLLALIADLGLGTVLIGETLSHKEKGLGLISASLITSFVAAMLLGILFIIAARVTSLDLGNITRPGAGAFLFALGCGVSGFSSVLGAAFTGLLRGSLQMYERIAFSIIKLTLLVLLAAKYASDMKEETVIATWVGGQAASASAFAFYLAASQRGLSYPRFATLRKLVPTSLSHHLLNLTINAPAVAMPFLVTVMLSPTVNAAFNAAWMFLNVMFVVPTALSTIVFAIGRADSERNGSRIRLSLFLSAIFSVAVALFCLNFSNWLLALFRPEYADIASVSLTILSLSYFGVALKSLNLAVKRINKQMLFASWIFAIGGFAELLFASAGGLLGGLAGLSIGWVAATALQAVFMAPAVLSAAAIDWKNSFILKRGSRGA
jgi:O-antigen/teichoic acid export membrane protein